jgi:hypothetical protein
MLNSIPVPLQAILYPLAGAAIILALGRILPGWVRRLLAAAAAVASLANLWSLTSKGFESVEVFWEPLNFFRMSPTLRPNSLSLLAGLTLAGVSIAIALGIRGSNLQRGIWHSILLTTLAGCLITTMAANLPTMALGSALIDLMLITLALLTPDNAEQGAAAPLTAVMPGIASTLLLFLSALRMDSQAGHTSLLAQSLPEEVLTLVGVAGALRLMIFPLHPRGWKSPRRAANLVLPVGVGVYLLARVQVLAPVLTDLPWLLTAGSVAFLAGALLTWSRSSATGFAGFWPSILVYQAGYALAFVVFLGGTAPWPLPALTLALGALAISWDGSLKREAVARPKWLAWLCRRIQPWQTQARSYVAARFPILDRWQNSWWTRHATFLLTLPILASLAGAPLTIGVRVRWPFYATLLRMGDPLLLLVLVADALVAATLWTWLSILLKKAGDDQPQPAVLLALIILIIPVVAFGLAPGILGDDLGLQPLAVPGVSVWGLGLLFVLPWLLGAWLARVRTHLESYLDLVWNIVNLDWLYRGAAWIGQRLIGAVHWLGQVGEGEGWWGWALIILALGIIFVTAR